MKESKDIFKNFMFYFARFTMDNHKATIFTFFGRMLRYEI